MIDLIGDIHGHSDKLEELLLKLGYEKITKHTPIQTGKYCSSGIILTADQKSEKHLEWFSDLKSTDYYQRQEKNVFFGHYWLKGEPSLYKENICCLDYSVAKGGKLVAYRHGGANKLDKENLVYV